MWQIHFFETDNGRCPTQEFIDDIDNEKDKVLVINKMGQLAEFGYKLPRNHAAFLEDKIYELRVKTLGGQLRFLYFFYDRDMIIITHGIKKKTKKVPEHEIKRAKDYREIYLSRKERSR